MKTRNTFILSLTAILTLAAGSAFGAYSGGTGEPSDPYQIADANDLLLLAADANDYNKCFILTADINLTGQVFTTAIIGGADFTGMFDGNGHKITNLTINGGSNSNIGLFGQIGNGGSVKNLGIDNCAVSGHDSVGGLVAGTPQGSSSIITACYSTGSVSGNRFVGGLVGYSGGSIINCYSKSSVSANEFAGGLVGDSQGDIGNCYSTGAVTGSNYVGGLVGYRYWGHLTSSFWDTQTSGQTTSAGGTGKTTAEMKTLYTFISAGWDFLNVWGIDNGQTYPYFRTNPTDINYSGGTGEPGDPYQIADANDLLLLAVDVNDYGKSYILAADINLAGVTMTPVGNESTPFIGVFDGNYNIISNAVINQPSSNFIGLFGYVGSGGQIRNLGVEDVNITGDYYVGGLIGHNENGSISNCHSTGTVSGITDSQFVGGLVGFNVQGSITVSYSTGSVSGSSFIGGLAGYSGQTGGSSIVSCYSTSSVSGTGEYIGGLVGDSGWSTIISCYSTGSVNGNGNYVGGLVGLNYNSIISCFWDIQTSGQVSGGGEGKTTAQMKKLSTFTSAEWDFVEVWGIGNGQTYPYLKPFNGINSADLNYSGTVDFEDFAILAANWLSGK